MMKRGASKALTLVAGLALMAIAAVPGEAGGLPEGYWSSEDAEQILERTLTVRLDPELSELTEAERETLDALLQAGEIMHRLYLEQRHAESLTALADLEALAATEAAESHARQLLDLYRIFKGPIATTLANERVPFLPVAPETPGKSVYPQAITRQEMRAYLEAHPLDRAELLHVRRVVRRATGENLARDRATLATHPTLAVLHPALEGRLEALATAPDESTLYAVPYSVAYAPSIMEVYRLLRHAAATIQATDPDFAAYLANRARDLLSDDYEAGDASWVRGRFGRLNAQIGSYETYDDELLGVKSFFSASLLLRDEETSTRLAGAIRDLQRLEDSLPYAPHKRVDSDIPVGVYSVIADYGQARGTNTATILPNESDHARKYGRTILLRQNVMTHPELFANTLAAWTAAVAPEHADDLTLEGGFNRTLWHEIGHYLGPAKTTSGDDLGMALGEYSDLVEELKSDLVSLYLAPRLLESGYYTEEALRAVYADGIRRTLQRVKPRRAQPYQTMQLMQMNYFLAAGLLRWEEGEGRLIIDYEVYPEAVASMLEEVLAIQSEGDADKASAFIERYGGWDESTHGALGERIAAASTYRYRLVRYAVLGE